MFFVWLAFIAICAVGLIFSWRLYGAASIGDDDDSDMIDSDGGDGGD